MTRIKATLPGPAARHLPLFGITATYRSMPTIGFLTATYRSMPTIGFLGFHFSLLTPSFVLAWLYLRSRGSILGVAVFDATGRGDHSRRFGSEPSLAKTRPQVIDAGRA